MKTVALGEIVGIKGGGTPDKSNEAYWGGHIPWASVKDFKTSEIADTQDRITEQGVQNSATNIIPAGSIIVPTRMAVGKAAINLVDMAINQDLKALTPKANVDTRYLLHALLALSPQLERQATGATVKGITLEVLRSLAIPLPPLDEQKRIAAILDQADELRRKRQRAIDRINQLSQAIFYEMFGDPSINPMNWPLATIGDLAKSTQYGTSGKAGDLGKFAILRMGNLSAAGEISLKNLKYIDFPEKDVEKYTVRTGDILFNRTNSPDLVGKTAVYYGDKPIGFAGYLVRLRVNENAVPEYISSFLNSPFGKKVLRGMCKAIIGMANINAKELRSIIIPVPPIELQRHYQAKLLEIRGAIGAPVNHKDALDNLFQSLQHRAFQGEL